MIGLSAGGTAMYQAMHSLGFAAESDFHAPVRLSAAPKGASVLVLGAGVVLEDLDAVAGVAQLVGSHESCNTGAKHEDRGALRCGA